MWNIDTHVSDRIGRMDERNTAVASQAEALQKKKRRGGRSGVRGVVTISVTIALVAVASLVFVFRDRLTGEGLRSMFRGNQNATVQSDAFTYEIGTGQVFTTAMGGGLAVASSSAVELLNDAGETVFKQMVSYGTPAVLGWSGGALFCDLGGTGCVLADLKGGSTVIPAAGEILTASMNENGWFAVVTGAVGYKGLTSVYDSAGTERFKWWSGSGYVLRVALSPDNRALAVLCAEAGGGKLHVFHLDSEEEQAVAGFDNELPFDLAFLGDDRLCVVSQDAVSFLAEDGTLKNRWEPGENYLLDYDLSGQGFAAFYLSPYRGGGGGALVTLDRDGKALGRVETVHDVTGLSANGRRLLATNAAGLTVYGQDLSVLYEEERLMTARKSLLCPDGAILMLSAYSAEKLTY